MTDLDYCDFVVWTPNDIFIERIQRNEALIERIIDKSKTFFHKVVLPELIGKFFSTSNKENLSSPMHRSVTSSSTTVQTSDPTESKKVSEKQEGKKQLKGRKKYASEPQPSTDVIAALHNARGRMLHIVDNLTLVLPCSLCIVTPHANEIGN